MSGNRWKLLLGGTALVASGAADARSRVIAPYIEVGQVVSADLTNDDVLTYSTLAAGIDASIETARTQAQLSYRYERRISWDDDVGDSDVHTGLAQAAVKVARGVQIDGGALATRTRSDIRGDDPGVLTGNIDNVTQVYSAYVGPTVSTNVGAVQIGASYHFGYTKVEVPNATGVGPGQPRLDYYDDSKNHLAQATVGVAAGTVLPVGVTVSGAYERDDAGQLDQRYEGVYGRGDVTLPLSGTLAIRGGVGYEKIKTSQRDAVVTAAGDPVVDGNGRFVTNEASPRRIAYQTDGLIYDAGVIWRPTPRLQVLGNVGWRYGDETYTGALSYTGARGLAAQVTVYDGVQTFGRQLRQGLENMPTSFVSQRDPFGQDFNGCVFGSQPGGAGAPGSGAGGCLNDVFQSISTASYRARGIDGVISIARGRTNLGVGAGYANRKLYAPRAAPGIAVFGAEDESYYGQVFWSYALDRVSNIDANVFANYSQSGVVDASGVFGAGATGSYSRSFGRLGAIASLGVYTSAIEGVDDDYWSAQALLGARYQF